MNHAPSTFAAQVRRIDAHLRARYPTLITNIFELEGQEYVIVFPRKLLDASHIADEFHRNIRFVCVPVSVSNLTPEHYVREIPVLSDQDAVGSMQGIALPGIDILNLLMSRFPSVPFSGVKSDSPGTITIVVGALLDKKTNRQILDFARDFAIPTTVEIDSSKSTLNSQLSAIDTPMYVAASGFRQILPNYLRTDEAFWFDNIAHISSGALGVNHFPGMDRGAYRCYFDFTSGQEHVNLRQALLLYDEIWCSLPLAERHQQFLARQRLTESDLLDMVEAGRLRFVTTQPEERLHLPFLKDLIGSHPDSLMGRRTTAALLLADIVTTAQTSLFTNPDLLPEFRLLASETAKLTGVSADHVLQISLWPLSSLRNCLWPLLAIGSKGGPIGTLAEIIASQVRTQFKVDIELEARIFGEAVHIGHALNATVFGAMKEDPGHHFIKAHIGRLLNLHRNFSAAYAGAWLRNESRREHDIRIMPSIPIFDFYTDIPLREILADTSLGSTRLKGLSLYARIAKLSVHDREDEIRRLAAALREFTRKRPSGFMDFDTMQSISSLIVDISDLVLPIKLARRTARAMIRTMRKRSSQFDKAIGQIEVALDFREDGPDLHFLSQIDRVASLRRKRV